jgi:hypothetical protein
LLRGIHANGHRCKAGAGELISEDLAAGAAALWWRRLMDEIDGAGRLAAEAGFAAMEVRWATVEDAGHVDRRARRLLAVHPLRTAGALQLGAALVGCDEHPDAMPFVTLDKRLAEAARREWFTALP